MHYHHLYADDQGESHWRVVEVPLAERSFAPPAKSIEISEARAAQAALFLRLAAGWDEPIHTTPKRQTLVVLRGVVEVTASDGDSRRIGPGEVWLMEDTHGKGHRTQVIGGEAMEAVIVQYD